MEEFDKTMLTKEINVRDIIVKSNLPACDYAANPYTGCAHACKYCYASFMKRFSGHDEQWGTFVDIKNWGEIKNPDKYIGKEIFLGSVTDPYQPAEESYQRTRRLLKELQGRDIALSIATKSDLIVRDLDLIKTFPSAKVSFSVNTLDEAFKSDMDCSVSIERKLEAMKKFHDAGVKTVCFVSPIFPEITDCRAIITRVKDICDMVWLENLNLRGEYKPVIMRYIAKKYPQHLKLYNQIYNREDKTYWFNLNNEMTQFCEKDGLKYLSWDEYKDAKFDSVPVVVNFFYHAQIKKSAKKCD